jgi:hypothetical protein
LLKKRLRFGVFFVGAPGFEPGAPCSQSKCATGLRYAPIFNLSRLESDSLLSAVTGASSLTPYGHQVCEYNAKDEYPSSNKRSNSADKTACDAAFVARASHSLYTVNSPNFYSYTHTRSGNGILNS